MPIFKARGGRLVSFTDPDVPAEPMLVGAAMGPDPQETLTYAQAYFAYADAHGGEPDIYRSYDGGWVDDWFQAGSGNSATRGDWRNRASWHSFKIPPADVNAGSYDQRIIDFVNSIPVTGHTRMLTYWHEPENDIEGGAFTAAAWRAAAGRVGRRVRDAAHPDVRYGPIYMEWTVNPLSGRDIDDYWPGAEALDFVGWDVYNDNSMQHDGRAWRTVADRFTPMLDFTRQASDLPLAVAEFGSVADFGDPNRRPAWVRDAVDFTANNGGLAICYWDEGASTVGRGDWYLRHVVRREQYPGDFPITSVESDDAMIAEWNEIVTTFRQG